MIKRINIENIGLFKDFEWKDIKNKGNTVIDLKKQNIFYGRNYSGKTTLSRIIRALETKELSSKYLNPKFEVVLTDNRIISESNYKTNPINVRCFNEDFIKENLRFIIDPESEIIPFAILGENSEIEAQIEKITNVLGINTDDVKTLLYKDLNDYDSALIIKKQEFDDLETALNTQLAGKATVASDSIKNKHEMFGDIRYNITKLNQDIEAVLKSEFVPINSEKEELNLQIIKETQKAEVITEIAFDNKYPVLHNEAETLLKQPILDSNKISELLSIPVLNEWVAKGYELHNEDRDCDCKFCGNSVSTTRWAQLDKHFDEESKILNTSLEKLKNNIDLEIQKIKELPLPKKELFYVSFQSELEDVLTLTDGCLVAYVADLNAIKAQVILRSKNIHSIIDLRIEHSFKEDDLINQITIYNDIKQRNNTYSNSLSDKIKEAQSELKLLEVRRFVQTIQYSEKKEIINNKKSVYDTDSDNLSALELTISENEKKISELTRLLNNEEDGANRVNDYLQNYFGHQNLELQAIEEEIDSEKKIRFNIVRNNSIAYHLSEGECSIISFCYFMAKLDDIHTAGQKPIIFIDDPISSLDSNHIFYVYSLINAELFHKDRFEQIFISTHNLDFLKYLKRLKLTKNHHEYFIINRYHDFSKILLMPSYLKDYITEFNYLFDQIYQCANAEIITDDNHHIYYNFGNNARKFLEALLFYKYPSKIDNQTNNANSKRLLKYFGEDNQATILTDRVNNELSHLEEIFDRGMQPIEIPEMKMVAQFILDKIKEKDEEQFDALLESIGVISTTTLSS